MPRPLDARGHTLLELIATLLIIGIAASFAVPRMGGVTARARARGALDQVSSDLYLARTLAVREGARTVLRFQPRPDRPECHLPTYSVVVRSTPERTAKVTRLELGSAACLRAGAVDSIVFNSRGLPAGGFWRKVYVEQGGATDSLSFSLLGRTFRWY